MIMLMVGKITISVVGVNNFLCTVDFVQFSVFADQFKRQDCPVWLHYEGVSTWAQSQKGAFNYR